MKEAVKNYCLTVTIGLCTSVVVHILCLKFCESLKCKPNIELVALCDLIFIFLGGLIFRMFVEDSKP